MPSVVIPAHDEEAVIDRCLTALLADAEPGEFDVVVVANGCTDGTAQAARRHGPDVQVLERAEGGKIGALNEGDRAASGFPRIYLDADIVLTTGAARAVAAELDKGPALAAAPRVRVVTDSCSLLVAWHHEVWQKLPVMKENYVGSGVYAVSAEGHARIAPFPAVIADDEYVRRRFRREERATADADFDVYPSRTARDHVHRAVRGRAGNAQLEATASDDALGLVSDTPRGLGTVAPLLRRPAMWPRVAVFVALTLVVRVKVAARRGALPGWNRDASTRR